jgi:hypothetical protein
MKFSCAVKSFLLASLLALSAPFAHAAAMTNSWENSLIDFLFRGQAYTPPTHIWIGLFTTCPTDSTAGTEVSGGTYGRVDPGAAGLTIWGGTSTGGTSVSSGTDGTTYNLGALTYTTATADWSGTVVCFGGFTASTGGTLLFYAPLTANRTITNGSTASFAIGALTFQVDGD